MAKINLPKNIISKEDYLALSASQKEEYIHNFLKDFLDNNRDGITVSQVDEATYLGHSTIWHHLEILASRAQCLRIQHGDTFVYYSNKIIEDLKQLDIQDKFYRYCFNIVENTYGKFVRLQIKQENKSGVPRTNCGVIIHKNRINDIMNKLAEINERHLNDKHEKDSSSNPA